MSWVYTRAILLNQLLKSYLSTKQMLQKINNNEVKQNSSLPCIMICFQSIVLALNKKV